MRKLINWILSFFKEEPSSTNDFYKPRERLIYSYWNGNSKVEVDPMTQYKKVMEIWPELSIDIRVAFSPSKDALTCHDTMIRKIRGLFDIVGQGQGGLTEVETMELLDHFLDYCNTVKKNTNGFQTPHLGSTATVSSSTESQPTSKPLDTGSTENAPSTVPPVQLPSEPVLPSEPSNPV